MAKLSRRELIEKIVQNYIRYRPDEFERLKKQNARRRSNLKDKFATFGQEDITLYLAFSWPEYLWDKITRVFPDFLEEKREYLWALGRFPEFVITADKMAPHE